jgi:electron transport complex protein RnfE
MSNETSARDIVRNGLWRNNAALVPLLGLCPLLAVSTTLVDALALSLATLAVLLLTNLSVSLLRPVLAAPVRLLFYVLIIATAVSLVDQWMAATRFELYRSLGIFVPLIATNCVILARAELFASRQPPGRAVLDALATGAGFGAVLISVGVVRELIGRGTILAHADTLFGAVAADWEMRFGDGFLLVALPPGAFFTLAALVAAHRALAAPAAQPDSRPAGE